MSADLARHWQAEAERLSLELDLARAQAEQWRKLCAAAMVECARFEADLAILKGETYLALHGWQESRSVAAERP